MRVLWRLRYVSRGRTHFTRAAPVVPVVGAGWRDVTLQRVEIHRG